MFSAGVGNARPAPASQVALSSQVGEFASAGEGGRTEGGKGSGARFSRPRDVVDDRGTFRVRWPARDRPLAPPATAVVRSRLVAPVDARGPVAGRSWLSEAR